MSYDTPEFVARLLVEALRPACERIEIAGSLRRGKLDPKDIEICAISRVDDVELKDIWGNPLTVHGFAKLSGAVIDLPGWRFDISLKRNGPKYKRLIHTASGICCDLFIVTPETWGVLFSIRTGPAAFSKALATRALSMGMKVKGGQLWRVHRGGGLTLILTPEESDFFAELELRWLEPNERLDQWQVAMAP